MSGRRNVLMGLCLLCSIGSGADKPPATNSCAWSILSVAAEFLGFKRKISAPVLTGAPKTGPAAPRVVELSSSSSSKVFIKPTTEPRGEKEHVTEERRARLYATLSEKLKQPDRFSAAVKDFLAFQWIRSLMRQGSGVAVLFGNREQKIMARESASIHPYVEVLQKLVEKQVVILYDADSKMAPFIQKIAGPLGVGIASGARPPGLDGGIVVTIENSFLRLEAFSKAEESVISSILSSD